MVFSWVSPTNKTDRHDITAILLKVVLNTINPNPTMNERSAHRIPLDTSVSPKKTKKKTTNFNFN